VKLVARRPRPDLPDLPPLVHTMSNRSYPSAHATTSAAAAVALAEVLPRAPLYAVAAGLALSRLYLGVHYPSDTLAGAALGVAVAELAP
jgi:membrane-associated phospholipid phosphatase